MTARGTRSNANAPSTPAKDSFRFAFAFLCVFAGLALPSPGFGPFYVRAHTALGNALVEDRGFASGVRLRFEAQAEELATKPWQTTLVIAPPARRPEARVAVDLRTLGYLPTVAFVALVVATPVRSLRRSIGLFSLGLSILAPLLCLLIALPLVSFLGGQGPIAVFSLSPVGHVIVNVAYRALVAPPGMAYALPLLLFWGLSKAPFGRFGAWPFTEFLRKRPRDVTSARARSV